jgi:hypothetical protein
VLTPLAGVTGNTVRLLNQTGVGVNETSENRIGFGNTHRHINIAVSS